MRTFILYREVDETGVSGTGEVAEGCQFSNGEVVLIWRTFHSSKGIYSNIEEVELIHGHQGKTKVIWTDEMPRPKKPKKKKEMI